jgi:hypothetical protein
LFYIPLVATTTKIKALERNINAIFHTGDLPKKIPVYGVGYTGYTTVPGIQKRLQDTAIEGRPDGILVIESGCYVGKDVTANGVWGLYGLIVNMQRDLEKIKAANSNLLSYAQ